jgi:hypothetical protein
MFASNLIEFIIGFIFEKVLLNPTVNFSTAIYAKEFAITR